MAYPRVRIAPPPSSHSPIRRPSPSAAAARAEASTSERWLRLAAVSANPLLSGCARSSSCAIRSRRGHRRDPERSQDQSGARIDCGCRTGAAARMAGRPGPLADKVAQRLRREATVAGAYFSPSSRAPAPFPASSPGSSARRNGRNNVYARVIVHHDNDLLGLAQPARSVSSSNSRRRADGSPARQGHLANGSKRRRAVIGHLVRPGGLQQESDDRSPPAPP